MLRQLPAELLDQVKDSAVQGVIADWYEIHGMADFATFIRGQSTRLRRGLAIWAYERMRADSKALSAGEVWIKRTCGITTARTVLDRMWEAKLVIKRRANNVCPAFYQLRQDFE